MKVGGLYDDATACGKDKLAIRRIKDADRWPREYLLELVNVSGAGFDLRRGIVLANCQKKPGNFILQIMEPVRAHGGGAVAEG